MNFEFDKDIVLEDEVALLRPLQVSDHADLLNIAAADKTLLQFSPMQIYTPEMLEIYINKATADRSARIRYPFIIYDKKEKSYAGSTSFLNVSNPDDRLEIGATWIGREFQRTGLNRHCKYLLLTFAFDILGAAKAELRSDERNHASRAAIEKLGAQYEGTLRSHTLMYDGFRRNTCCYSILKSEWEGVKAGFNMA